MVEMEAEVVIVGAGIAGLATAVALKRVGIEALVLERSETLRTTGAALTIFPNGWLALEALGVSEKLASLYAPLKKGYITSFAEESIQEVPLAGSNSGGNGPRPMHRKALLESLAAELPAGAIRFSSKLTSIENQAQKESSIVILRLDDGTTIRTKVLIGCDGVNSIVARWLGLSPPVNSGRQAIRGLAVFPQGHEMNHEVYQFVGAGKRAGFASLNDNEIYWFLSYSSDHEGEKGIADDPELIQREIIENLAKDLPPIYTNVVRHADLSTVSWAPLVFRYPWNVLFGKLCQGNITVAGDAMHPMTPDLAQGGCSALEDAVVLGRHIGLSYIKNKGLVSVEIPRALEDYVRERRWRVAGLITGSYLSGWVQQCGYGRWTRFLRDVVFYRFLFRKIVDVVNFDCGRLPIDRSSAESQTKQKDV